MSKIKKFQILRVPIGVEYQRPILGRIYAIYAWFKCIKLFKFKYYGYNFYKLVIPKFEVT